MRKRHWYHATMAAFLNQLFYLSAIGHNWVQLRNGVDEQVLDDKNMGNSGC